MTTRVSVSPSLLSWARNRSGRTLQDLLGRFPKLAEWEAGTLAPTMRQLEEYAQATYTPIGFFYLSAPPVERVPIPDFRTIGKHVTIAPTPDLLDTIYACEQRQDWYREYAESRADDPVAVVGSATLDDDAGAVAERLRAALGFGLERRGQFSSWMAAFSGLAEHAEEAGILVMVSGIVGSNTHRRLNPDEFRGFALADALAPVVFINGADTKAAQIFTLAHELAHVTLGGSAVSRPDLAQDDADQTERWCNEVAAELLVPIDSLRQEYAPHADLTAGLDRLARYYKVSTLVVLRRIYDAKLLGRQRYRAAYAAELRRIQELSAEKPAGGNFYNTQPVRVSKRFAKALIGETLEGRTLHKEAFRLLGFKKVSAFEELGRRLGIA